jgi:antitoxin YefM
VAISAREARSRLFSLVQRVNDDHTPLRISSSHGDAIHVSARDSYSWQESIYLLRSPANTRRLMKAITRDGEAETVSLRTRRASTGRHTPTGPPRADEQTTRLPLSLPY